MYRFKFSAFLLLCTITTFSQKNFTFQPEHPKPGDKITITYEPAGMLLNVSKPVEAAYYRMNIKGVSAADDLALEKKDGKYTTTIQTDTATSLVFLGFSSDEKFDNNFNNGYFIQFYDGQIPKRGSFYNLSLFYQFMGREVGVDRDVEKAAIALREEIKYYPQFKDQNVFTYARLLNAAKKEEGATYINNQIDNYQSSLKSENDYSLLESLYALAKMPEKAKAITEEKKIKFPEGKWKMVELRNSFYNEKDPAKAQEIANNLMAKSRSNSSWEIDSWFENNYKSRIAELYANKKDWDNFNKTLNDANLEKSQIASIYNNTAWEVQKTGGNELKYAETWSAFATDYAKKEWMGPSKPKPADLTSRQWDRQRKFQYAMYADTYGMVQYRLGNFKKGLSFAKEAALDIYESKNANYNNTYALLAEKALPAKEAKKQIEQFFVKGKAAAETKEVLKRLYIKEKGNENGFDEYIVSLQKKSNEAIAEELRKNILNVTAPAYALLDLNGNKITSADLKGKVVVMDFWATWCGPCKASFPGMQKIVSKYKDDPNVKIVFVDTWESSDNKKKNAQDFIDNHKYPFQVLMDDENKVVEQYKVEGIPTKFVIDKNGIIRFKSVGFDGSDDALVTELTAMIELAAAETKKTF